MELNKEKMKNLILYISQNCSNRNELGAIKLNKILYYSDFIYYLVNGKSITNEVYIKRQFGPVPKDILTILDELTRENKLIIKETNYFGKPKREYIPLVDADLSQFNAYEIDLILNVSNDICKNHTATSISYTTHDKIWDLAQIGEEIPYYTVFVGELGEINEEDIKWAKEELERKKTAA